MNLYILVEGRRTEMAVYPAYLSHLLPQLQRVYYPFETEKDSYYIMSGFGYPNILAHIENCVRDMNRYPVYDYLVICLDTDEETAANRIRQIERLLNQKKLWPKHGQIKIICQQKCIETWFLGSVLHKASIKSEGVKPYFNHYDISRKDPEKMNRPSHYPGSVGDYHCHYLIKLCEAMGKVYTKRNPYVVCSKVFLDSLIERTRMIPHLKSFKNFLNFLELIKAQMELENQKEDI